jgi:hypothetical protein
MPYLLGFEVLHVEPEHTLFPLFLGDSLTDVDHGRTLSYILTEARMEVR